MIEEFLAVLAQAGLEPSLRELRDALWLTEHIAVPETAVTRTPSRPVRPGEAPGAPSTPPAPLTEPGGEPASSASGSAGLHAAGSAETGAYQKGLPARSPAVSALGQQLAIARSLRPVKRRVKSRTSFVLDEAATAARSADEGIWFPVLRAVPARWLDLALVIDESPSMVIWKRTVTEFQLLIQRLSAFRRIRVFSLAVPADPAGPLGLRSRSRPGDAVRDPATLADPTGRQVIMVLTDGIGPAWPDQRMNRLLEHWGRSGPTAVVSVLPQRMWAGSSLQVTGGRLYAATPGAPNRAWARQPASRRASPADAAPVPVLELSSRWLALFAQLVAGAPTWHRMALLTGQDRAPARALTGALGATPQETVQDFRTAASPLAFRLACYLSVTGLNLPVMRLVQQLMLPDSDPSHLAEVFLGGLLRPAAEPGEAVDPERVRYDFLPGVRDEFNKFLLRDDLLKVLHETSSFISERFGDPLDFEALIADPEGTPLPALTRDGEQVLAYLPVKILDRLGGPYRTLARRLQTLADEAHENGQPVAPAGDAPDAPLAETISDIPAVSAPVHRRYPSLVDPRIFDNPTLGVADQIKIGLWGAPASGKTTYLAALRQAVFGDSSAGRWNIYPVNDFSRDWLVESTHQLAGNRQFPQATTPATVNPIQYMFVGDLAGSRFASRLPFLRRRTRESRFILDVIDVSGEAFGPVPQARHVPADVVSRALDHLANSAGLIYLFDPLAERDQAIAANYLNRTIIELMERYASAGRVDRHLPHQISVCITKFDHPEIFQQARRMGLVSSGPDGMPRVLDEHAEAFFDALCDGEFWSQRDERTSSAEFVRNQLRSAFHPDRIRYFVSSSIGFWTPPDWGPTPSRFDPDDFANFRTIDGVPKIRGAIRPINVLEPLISLQQRITRGRAGSSAPRR